MFHQQECTDSNTSSVFFQDSSLPRHQSAFVKRKCSHSNEAPNKHLKTNLGRTQSVMQAQHLSLETENVTDANGNYDSYQRRQKGVSNIYNKVILYQFSKSGKQHGFTP